MSPSLSQCLEDARSGAGLAEAIAQIEAAYAAASAQAAVAGFGALGGDSTDFPALETIWLGLWLSAGTQKQPLRAE
jgi:hypothetical protein